MEKTLRRWTGLMADPSRILVVGGASLDVLHVDGQRTPSAGGAGLYTSLAAARAGATVTMLAPRPDPMPQPLIAADDVITWVGPAVGPDDLPRFEIAYGPDGDVVRFDTEMGAEPDLRPDLLDGLPDLPPMVFCVPFLDAGLQLAFVEDLSHRGRLTVANTYWCAVTTEREVVLQTASAADVFFCNEAEAEVLFGSLDEVSCRAGQIVFVTRGPRGATVIQGTHHTEVGATVVGVVDPTGAGDTFCGTVMAHLSGGAHPVEAARHGVAAAGWMIGDVGPALLFAPEPTPGPRADGRAHVDLARVTAMASLMADLDEASPFPFVGEVLPEAGDPGALDFYCSATLQQFGFWSRSDGRHGRPTYATVNGTRHKGSDYLWAAYLRWMHDDAAGLAPTGQAATSDAAYTAHLADDEGATPLPALPTHASLTRAYGESMAELGASPADFLTVANSTDRPLAALVRLLDHVAGYREDPLRKKSALLAIILRQRPEAWLANAAGDDSPPIVDYHVQRTCLRTGMVTADEPLRSQLVERCVLEADEEDAVRRAAYSAVQLLTDMSGRSMGAVDWFLFGMRHRCPEMTEPECHRCAAEQACARYTELFQPVLRTTAY